jgi:peptidoglycan/LPS O-acetylase OafA/YrhL
MAVEIDSPPQYLAIGAAIVVAAAAIFWLIPWKKRYAAIAALVAFLAAILAGIVVSGEAAAGTIVALVMIALLMLAAWVMERCLGAALKQRPSPESAAPPAS